MSESVDRLSELKIDRSQMPAPRRRWPWVVAGALVAVAVVGLLLYANLNGPVEVQVETVRLSQTSNGGNTVLDASGYVVARRQATVSSKIAGKVEEVRIEEGMIVEAGDIVATLDDSTQQAQLALAEAQLRSATSALNEIEAQLKQAEQDLKRASELAARKLVSESDLDAANANAETLRARLASGNSGVQVASRGLDVAKDQLDNTIIRAPFAGVVVTKNAQPGEMISPISSGGGFTRTGICTIVDMSSLEIEVDVNEAYIQRVSAKQTVTAILDAYPNWKIPAEVIAIVPTADRQKATVRVRIGFLEQDERILRDMGVKVAFLGETTPSDDAQPAPTVIVSRAAINSDAEGDFVWIVRGESVQRRAITQGSSVSAGVQIDAGLSAGDRIVTSSTEPLSPGQNVLISR